MREYIITSTGFEGEILLGFEQGRLRKFELKAALTDDQLRYLYAKFPLVETQLAVFCSKTSKVTEITDLSFERFWDEYAHKVGNKERARKLWEALTDADKLKAFEALPKYRYYLSCNTGIAQVFAERYISQRRFENDFKVTKR